MNLQTVEIGNNLPIYSIEWTKAKAYKLLVFVLLSKAICMVFLILFGGIGLGPDEAQYWTWSQALDWGYYSKPPGIAWQIWLGTQLFGSTELGVRSLSIVLSFLQALGINQLALSCGLNPKKAMWCALMMALTPIGILGSFLAITDGGFLLFWILACNEICSTLSKKENPSAYKVGLLIALGALFKWPIYIFWIFYLDAWKRFFPRQSFKEIMTGILISAIGLLPSVWWNWSHSWVTFRHVSSTLQGGHAAVQSGNFLEFLGSQVLLVSPILFILLMLCFWKWVRSFPSSPPSIAFCARITFGSLAILLAASLTKKVQGNWGIFAYPTSFVLIGWYAFEKNRDKWIKLGIGVGLLLTGIGLIAGSQSYLPYKMNPFKHNLGWDNISTVLKKQGYDPKTHFLVSDKYQTTSLLSFYGTKQKRAYFFNLLGSRQNQFSYWPGLETASSTGYFVAIENGDKSLIETLAFYQEKLDSEFKKVEFIGSSSLLYENNKPVKNLITFKCHNYSNHLYSDKKIY